MPPKYVTTSAEWNEESTYKSCGEIYSDPEDIPDPVVPKGDSWELVGTCATSTRLFWTWKRTTRPSRKGRKAVPL